MLGWMEEQMAQQRRRVHGRLRELTALLHDPQAE